MNDTERKLEALARGVVASVAATAGARWAELEREHAAVTSGAPPWVLRSKVAERAARDATINPLLDRDAYEAALVEALERGGVAVVKRAPKRGGR